MKISVRQIQIPAFSTLADGVKIQTGEELYFCDDHRPMRPFGEASRDTFKMVMVKMEPSQVLSNT